MKKIETVSDLRNHYVTFGGFSGSWNVLLEFFKEVRAFGPLIAVSEPLQSGSWLTKQFPPGLVREVTLGGNMSVLVIEDWDNLVKLVQQDALRNRMLVQVSGNLFGGSYEKAIAIAGAVGSLVRRAVVGVDVGAPYWNPTEEQLENGFAKTAPVSPIFA